MTKEGCGRKPYAPLEHVTEAECDGRSGGVRRRVFRISMQRGLCGSPRPAKAVDAVCEAGHGFALAFTFHKTARTSGVRNSRDMM
jgi:hypothetical protein